MNLRLLNRPLAGGEYFFDAPSAAFAKQEFVQMAKAQFAEVCSEAVFASFISPNGYEFIRCLGNDHNEEFMKFLKKKFDGACTFHPALQF